MGSYGGFLSWSMAWINPDLQIDFQLNHTHWNCFTKQPPYSTNSMMIPWKNGGFYGGFLSWSMAWINTHLQIDFLLNHTHWNCLTKYQQHDNSLGKWWVLMEGSYLGPWHG